MNSYRYILEPYKGTSTRYTCPSCQKRELVLYVDTQTGRHLSPKVGRCNREDSCGYHYTPKQYFQDNDIKPEYHFENIKLKQNQPRPISLIPVELFKESLWNHQPNHFVKYLISLLGPDKAQQIRSRYFIGNSDYWQGSTIFWQIDTKGRIRTGKIMLYSPDTGKRVKQPKDYISWVHSHLKGPEYILKQCFFGEHLLQEKEKTVAVVESEKTACIASAYFPKMIWIASGSKEGLNPEKCKVLRGRNVVLFPDLGAFDKWTQKAKELPLLNIKVFDLLERKATEAQRQQGWDLADYLVQFRIDDFASQPVKITGNDKEPIFQIPDKPRQNWNEQINELQDFFSGTQLPAEPVQLNKAERITDLGLFISSHLSVIQGQNGNSRFLPYLERLQELKRILCN